MNKNVNNWVINTNFNGASMQHDGVYGFMSWRDIAVNNALDVLEFRHYVWLLTLAIGLPLAVVA